MNIAAKVDDIDPRAFRDALSEFATGIAVVTTTAEDGERIGMTVSSFNSVSLEPPLVLFSIARSAFSLSAFARAERYAVNLLHAEQVDVSSRFARALADKWASLEITSSANGSPIFPDALAVFECTQFAQYDGGDHVIFVGRVSRFVKNGGRRPLLFFRGGYHAIAEC
ncbi:flavin reductase family protein [Caballeronia sp. LjRoot34]|uniref:flavin reductase family protein n=1 Tax=Caballeronia sp. LjRoot34 TaxID=3342325 RepID=UPI003ECD7BEC